MYCKHCGKQIDDDSSFCRYCGRLQSEEKACDMRPSQSQEVKNEKQVETPSKVKSSHNTTNSQKNLLWVAIGIILIAIIIWPAMSFFGGSKIADITIDKVSLELTNAVKKYDEVYKFHEGLACVKKGDKFGFIDKLGHEIIPCEYDAESRCSNNRIIVKRGDRKGVIDTDNNLTVPCIYDGISTFDDSVSVVYLDGKQGLIDLDGNVILPIEYKEINEYKEGLISVVDQDDKVGFVDKKGNVIIDFIYEIRNKNDHPFFSDGWALVNHNGEDVFIDKLGKVVLKPNYDVSSSDSWSEGVIPVCKSEGSLLDDTWRFYMAYMDRKGNLTCEFIEAELSDFLNGYARIWKHGIGQGLIDIYGNVILPCKYQTVFRNWDNNDGLIGVENYDGKWGFFNTKTNSFTIPLEYDNMLSEFFEGLVCVERNDKYGFLNKEGNVVIPFIYDKASDFSEGFAVVKRYGKYGYVDRYGHDTFD